MWSAHEIAQQRRLDNKAQATNSYMDGLRADNHFNAVARRYDHLTADAAINLLTELVIDAIETHRRYAEQDPRFVRRYIDEAAYQRWFKAEAAKSFFDSPSFIWLVGVFGIDPEAARNAILQPVS